MGSIYKIINSENNKIYIGQTINSLDVRWKQHQNAARRGEKYKLYQAMRKYGIDNFSIQKIEEVPDEKLNEREQYWIEHYGSFQNGYNSTLGGEGNQKVDTEKIYKLWRENKSVGEISKELNLSKEAVCHKLKNLEDYSIEESVSRGNRRQFKTYTIQEIDQYDLEGNYLKTYKSMGEASRQTGIQKNSIWLVVNNKEHAYTAGGFLWARKGEKVRLPTSKKVANKNYNPILQFDLQGNFLKEYSCGADAAKELGIRSSDIYRVCKGERKSSHGYIWKYK